MTTTLEKPGATPKPGPGGLRFVAVRANLMPTEVLSKRQIEVVRKQVVLGLAVIVGLLVAWFGLSWYQTSAARSDLSDAQNRGRALQSQQQQFAPLVAAQGRTQTIQDQLRTLMTGDLPWKDMLATLRSNAPGGTELTTVTGSVASMSGTTGTQAPTPAATPGAVGQLTITGTARSKADVASYSDRLGTAKGIANPLITNVTANGSTVTFTVTASITSSALGGRYAAAPATKTGGK